MLKTSYQKLKGFYNRYERWMMPVTLLAGFLLDYFTFTSIAVNTSLILLTLYWLVTALLIYFVLACDEGRFGEKLKSLRLFAPLIFQFLLGSLLGGTFIFYWFSASFAVSWPFILLMVFLMVSNEAFRHYLLKPIVMLGSLFFSALLILAVALPFLLHSLNSQLFLLAGVLSALVFFLYALILSVLLPAVKKIKLPLFFSCLAMLLAMNLFYFYNIIPPVPLSIREARMYHSVRRVGNEYELVGEKENFWQKFLAEQTVHLEPEKRLYAYTAIFAPTNLDTTIVHEWQFYDENKKEWLVKDRLSFTLIGGRQLGFRGYSYKTTLPEGKWRIFVRTKDNKTLGEIKFKLISE